MTDQGKSDFPVWLKIATLFAVPAMIYVGFDDDLKFAIGLASLGAPWSYFILSSDLRNAYPDTDFRKPKVLCYVSLATLAFPIALVAGVMTSNMSGPNASGMAVGIAVCFLGIRRLLFGKPESAD